MLVNEISNISQYRAKLIIIFVIYKKRGANFAPQMNIYF